MQGIIRLLLSLGRFFSRRADNHADVMGQEKQEWRGTMQAAATLTITNMSGNVDVAGTDGPEFRITAIKRGTAADIGRIGIEVKGHETGTMVRAFPVKHLSSHNASVHFTIEIPSSASLIAHTGNGNLQVSNITNVEAHSANGSIRILDASFASAETTNGQIDVSLRDPKWEGALLFRSRNGGIRVQLPDQASAELDATTSNGSVSSEFSLNTVVQSGRHYLRARIGANTDGRQLICKTANGHVHVARAAA